MTYRNHLYSRELRVDPRNNGEDFSTIKAACDYAATITPRDSGNFVLIRVNAGYYVENDFTVPTYTDVVGITQSGEVDIPGVYIAPAVTAITGARSAFITMSDWSSLTDVDVTAWTGSVSGLSADFGVVKAIAECWISGCKISIQLSYSGAFNMCAVLGTGPVGDVVRLYRSTISTAGGTSSIAVKTSQRIQSYYCQLIGHSNIGYYSSTNSVSVIAFGRMIDDLDSPQVTAVHQTSGTMNLFGTRVPLNMRSGSATFNEIQPTPQQLETAVRAKSIVTHDDYTMDAYEDGTVEAGVANTIITMAPPADTEIGQAYVVKNTSSGIVTVDGNGSVFDLRSTLNDGIVAHWSFDELSGTRFDSVGNNNLVDNNTVEWRAGLVKNAASYTAASGEYFKLDSNPDIDLLNTSFSFSFWIKNDAFNSSSDAYFFKGADAGTDADLLIRSISGLPAFTVWRLPSSTLSATSPTTFLLNTWYHVYVEFDSTTGTVGISVDNEVLNTVTDVTFIGGLRSTGFPLWVGRWTADSTTRFDGAMDNATFYKRKLTTAERLEMFAEGAPNAEPFPSPGTPNTLNNGIVCHWNLDEVSGSRSDNVGSTNLTSGTYPTSDTGLVNLGAKYVKASVQYLAASSSAEIQQDGTDLTWSIWARSDSYSVTAGSLISKQNGSNQDEIWIYLNPGTGKIDAVVYDLGVTASAVTASSTTSPTLGVWYHVLVEWDNSAKNLSVSVNGEAFSTTNAPGLVISPKVADFHMGNAFPRSANVTHDGMIDEVTFYKRKLTPTEHTGIYANGAPNAEPFPAAELFFELPETNNFIMAQKNAAGTWNIISSDLPVDAADVSYTPTTPGDWVDPDPDDVQEGLDDLAAALNSLVNAHSVENWTFTSPSGVSGTFYAGGYYRFAATHNDFSPVINFGTANSSYAAHVLIVVGAVPVDTVTITVTGTSINDLGVRTTSDTENIVLTTGNLVNDYFETSKKFIGLVTIEAVSGTAVNCNYGWCKYFDNDNEDFIVKGSEATWRGGASDAGADLRLRHHKTTGWTYNAGATPTPPTPIASLVGDHSTESEIKNNEEGAWKRTNFATSINGSGSEGIILEIVTTSAKTFELGNFSLHFVED